LTHSPHPDLTVERRETLDAMLAGIRLTPSMMSEVEARALALRCSVSQYIRALIQRDIDAQSATHAQRGIAKPATQ
jgi:hypothetical protein